MRTQRVLKFNLLAVRQVAGLHCEIRWAIGFRRLMRLEWNGGWCDWACLAPQGRAGYHCRSHWRG